MWWLTVIREKIGKMGNCTTAISDICCQMIFLWMLDHWIVWFFFYFTGKWSWNNNHLIIITENENPYKDGYYFNEDKCQWCLSMVFFMFMNLIIVKSHLAQC